MNWKSNLNTKLIIIILIIVTIFISISSYYNLLKSQAAMQEEMSQYGNSIATALSIFSIENILSWNYPEIQSTINNIGEKSSGICSVKIFHKENIVAEYSSECHKNNETEIDYINYFSEPIVTYANNKEIILGKIEVILSRDNYELFLSQKIKSMIFSSLFLLLGITVWTFLFIKLLILIPIKKIEKGTEIIGGGNLGHRIKINNKDEIGNLATAFNNMAKKLKIINDENEGYKKNLEEKITERTTELRELNQNLENKVKERTKDLEMEKNKTFSIIENFFDPIIVTDENYKITLFNPVAEKIFKLSENDLGKKVENSNKKFSFDNFKNIIHVPYKSKFKEKNKKEEFITEEVTVKIAPDSTDKNNDLNEKIDNTSLVYKVLTSSVKNKDGKIIGYMKMFYDLTREKLIDQMKNEFISISAHQLRTPLSGIKWSLKMILNGEMGELENEVKKYLIKTYEANERMIALVNDLLDVSRIEEGRYLYKLKLLPVEKIVKEIINSEKIATNKKKIEIIFEENKKAKIPKIKLDDTKIKYCFQNLIENAIKYSNNNSKILVKIDTAKKNGKNYVKICFTDNGIGISNENQKRLFTKFFRAENALRQEAEGTGLGLFIVKNIVTSHKGFITCESEENKGSTFCIFLPI